MRTCWWIVLLAACGRVGFDPVDLEDEVPPDAGSATSTQPCIDVELGSELGPAVASGSTAGGRNRLEASCGGDGNEITHGWIAPATGRYRFDTCGSDPTFDAVLYVRDGGCSGALLDCSAEACNTITGFHGIVTLDLEAGQQVVIVVDAAAPTWDGTYRLAIEAR